MKQILSSLFILCILVTHVIAQDRTVTGTIKGKDDELPLPGVSVRVKGSQQGTQTGSNGLFSIKIPGNNAVLVFSYVGYTSQEINVGTRSTIDIVLTSDSKQLGEVVVTALGVGRDKRTLGYSVQKVGGDQIQNSRETNLVNALAGKVAGVQINSSGGQAGSSARIVIRGNTSITGDNQPLFVIDGIPMDNSVNRGITENVESVLFNGVGGNRGIDIDPNIVQEMTVLKGAAATALYGARGAFGVVLITTKKGQKTLDRKFPSVSYTSSLSLDEAIIKGFQSTYLQGSLGKYKNGLPLTSGGYSEVANGASQTSASWGPHRDSVSQAVIDAVGMPTIIDPRKEFYRDGKVWNNSVALSGGGDNSTYIMTYTNLDQEGVVPNNTFKRNSLQANFTSKLTKSFNTSTSVNYINSVNKRMPEGNTKRSYLYTLNFAPISFDSKKAYEDGNTNRSWTTGAGFDNPYWLVNNVSMPSSVDRFILSNESTLEILPWLKLTNRVGLDTYNQLDKEQVNVGEISVPDGRMYEAMINRRQINNDLILLAEKKINDDWSINGLIGNNINSRTYTSRTIRGLNLSIPGFYDITNVESVTAYQADSKRRTYGLYASGTIDYKTYLYLNLTARNDWSSTLPVKNNSFFYPSASVGFVFTDLLGLANNDIFPYGKLRVSYARAGNDAPEYLTNKTYSQANPSDGTRGNISFPYNGLNAFQTGTTLANNELTPEMVTEKEIGADLRFFKSRLGIDFSYYDKVSDKQILSQEVAASSGYVEAVVNAGKVSNKGVELTLTGSPIKTRDFEWSIQVNYAKNNYKLKALAEGVDNIFLGGFTTPQIRIDKDYGYGVIWGLGFKRNEEGKLIIGEDGLPITNDDYGPIGNVTAKYNGGIRNTFRYKSLSLSTLFDFRKGGDLLNLDLYYSSYYGTAKVTENRNTFTTYDGVMEDGTVNTTPVLRDQAYYQNWFSAIDENFVEDGSFIKLREVTLSYNLPASLVQKTPFQSIGFAATGRDLWVKSNFSYGDPEGSLYGSGNAQGFYHAVTPGTKGVTFSLNVKF
ncbi:TonB-dependent receptor [Arcticibacter svalbardensis MN12-7]|uniref:TonB-dependent receptor n=1 Tax=Arcticibacter svalbardensis MN12-7 TaxID=1150600 RepID=R9GYH7_9SPHI|nr:SusC/RagA family TonB-linked outer membrane protein [Arcticibacter svalbardensis]EOR96550.1 TonB-dependent receptor [Arcticibacter svalbardensis MN12-7]